MGFMVQQVGSIPAISHNIKIGNNIKGQAPHHICTGEICDNCKKIIDDGGCFIIEVEDGSDQKNPYRTGRYCAIKKEAAKKLFGQEHNIVYGGEDKYGHRTRGNKNVLWVVWSF